ncbi:hypothetical protein SAMN05444007_108256 [Cribrihabitans marinus]|uniref:Phage tail lysozyme domain-containing protein n=1 Tax=Cribrihabitans marinus TaxID=1227549 RepID=A0A1H7CX30_9RHOB|nr:phage tail tip lysozyme [Cribrihabitans marinus]GGH36381.1 hypothetical protein GCM10010973_30270 [Cribrihabitans marinus]SEJ91742.1 hypothetical protein SAMN05444007_108256 [Cribrihabitans marinus]
MSFAISERSDDEILAGGEFKAGPAPSFGETIRAQAEETRILKDLNGRSSRVEQEYVDELKTLLGPHQLSRPPDPRQTPLEARHDWLFSDIRRAQSQDPERFTHLPTSVEEFDAEVISRRQAELADARDILARSDSWSAELVGDLWAEITTPQSAMMLLGGASAGARVLTTMAIEGGVAALDEARTLPTQFDVAEDLDQPAPRAGLQVGVAALTGAGLGGLIAGGARLLQYGSAKARATGDQRPPDARPAEFEASVEAERERLERGDRPADEPDVPLRLSDFDFGAGGNASPQTNRVGYVYGRLIERGMEPHIAAGFVGNFMVESGVGLNPQAIGDGGSALGIAQWNDRRPALIAFAQARGKPPTDLDVQIEFLFHELATTEARAGQRIFQAQTAQEAARLVSDLYERPGIPHMPRRLSHAAAVMAQYQSGSVPKWDGAMPAVQTGGSGFTGYNSSRPYTGSGQVIAGDDIRVDVEYEVVDISALRQATGDLQPRDRGRGASDVWVSDTAARLDPAQLLDSPWADRGAPLVGPDNIIESGNGRVRAIERAYDQVPDRADAYRQAIEQRTGRPIPPEIERPVMIARRTSDLSAAERRRMVVDAQDSGVARMNATERAQIGQRALNADLLASYRSGAKLTGAENRDFARAFAGAFPRSERNAFVTDGGRLSIDGIRQIQDSLFARAWDAPDIVARAVEAEPGELKTLIDAMADAAPEVARLRADIEAGLVRPEMDITGFILEAARLIMQARDLAGRGGKAAEILEELLADEDLLLGSLAPLTRALVRKFMPRGRQAPADKIARFLKDYAEEARKAGRTGDALDPVGPLDVLKRMDPEAFGDLDQIGAVRALDVEPAPVDTSVLPETAFADGASSPDAQAADALVRESFDEPSEELRDAVAELRSGDADLDQLPDGTTFDDILSDLDADETLDTVIDLCTVKGAA